MQKAKRLKPGPKTNAKLRHKMAALYFCSVATEEGWTCERIGQLCEFWYGIEVTPDQIARWADVHRKAARKIKDGEFRVLPDVVR